MTLDIVEIGYYKDGVFKGKDADGAVYDCYVFNMEDWDKLYDHLTTPINVEIVKDKGDRTLVIIQKGKSMGTFGSKKYLDIWNSMEADKWYKAADLGVAPATMTALINRGMVESTNTSPKKYKKIKNTLVSILDILSKNPCEYFTLYKADQKLGMMCSVKNEKILDAWDKDYDIAGVNIVQVGSKKFEI